MSAPALMPVKLQDPCTECGSTKAVTGIRTGGPELRYLLRSRVEMKRVIERFSDCPCGNRYSFKVTAKRPEKVKAPVRKDIVAAIKRLRAAGWKFPWEAGS